MEVTVCVLTVALSKLFTLFTTRPTRVPVLGVVELKLITPNTGTLVGLVVNKTNKSSSIRRC